jgi:hypothetical protein
MLLMSAWLVFSIPDEKFLISGTSILYVNVSEILYVQSFHSSQRRVIVVNF